jgi:hypothetical protein
MSDAAPGSISLEENALEPEAPPPPVTTETPPPAVQTADDGEPEGTIVNPGGEKLVPLGALAGTREKLRAEKEAREKVEAEVATLREQTKDIEQIKAAWQAAQPVIQQARQAAQQQQPKPQGPLSDQDAIEYAKDLDLYKADGTPDTARAQRLAARQEALAAKSAQQYVQPLQQQNAQTQSAANFQAVASWKDAAGVQPDPAILKEVWSNMPPEMTAQPNIARVMFSVAMGEMMIRGKYKTPVTPPPPVLETASLGGGTARTELTSHERGFIEATGMKPKDYEETSARYKPGERNSLE